jgi:hypothetical protein
MGVRASSGERVRQNSGRFDGSKTIATSLTRTLVFRMTFGKRMPSIGNRLHLRLSPLYLRALGRGVPDFEYETLFPHPS